MSGENYRSATKSHDPGWNDPPKLGYSSSTVSPGQSTKLNLNKRVAFPVASPSSTLPPVASSNPMSIGESSLPQFISPTSAPPSSVPAGNLPVNQLTVGTPPRGTTSQILKADDANNFQGSVQYPAKPEMIQYISDTLEKCVLKLEPSKHADIRKRLSGIERSWADEKLGESLARKLYRLAQALTEGKAADANEIHRSIVVEHGRDCVQWAPALRQLVMALPKPQAQSDGEAEELGAIMKPI